MNLVNNNLEQLAKLIRYYILQMTYKAGSGHMTSSLSAVELMTVLFFKYLHFDIKNPPNLFNDRIIFSKGHASPLFYALYAAAGIIPEKDLWAYRTFASNLEGHPTMRFPFTEMPTGSLGQGLSIGVGEALALRAQISNFKFQISNFPKVYVLLGDGEMAEGQVWEAMQTAVYYKLNNLIAVVDVNRLGQSQQSMLGNAVGEYAKQVAGFGWRTYVLENGHDTGLIEKAYSLAIEQSSTSPKPAMIIAKTIKGKGISFLEDKNGWHGKVLTSEELEKALIELGEIKNKLIVRSKNFLDPQLAREQSQVIKPSHSPMLECDQRKFSHAHDFIKYKKNEMIATREAFGKALVKLGELEPNIVVLDGDMKNSTYTELFAKQYPDRFYQLFIAEQNMVSVSLGMAKFGLKPVVSTFASFLTRAADQIRMADFSGQNILFNGTHGGVSIGQDGPSQMGLTDISLFRSILNSTVLYPADAVATEKLLFAAEKILGIVYLRTQRPATPVIYGKNEEFTIGGSKIHKCQMSNDKCQITIVAAGITVIEALKAQQELAKEKITVNVIDCYCVKPIDRETLLKIAAESTAVITVEDHGPVGGLGDAVLAALAEKNHVPVYKLAVSKTPRSGTSEELFRYEEIDSYAIIKKVRELC